MNTAELMKLLEEIPEPRKGNAIKHNLKDVLLIGLLCIICNGETFTDMELFGETHYEELKQYLALPHGVPSHDTFGNVFSKVNSDELKKCFPLFVEALKDEIEKHTIAIDGKTIRRSKSVDKKATHVVTAYSSEFQLVMGQLATDEKSNEIKAIPQLLDLFEVKGTTITIDAMGTQKEIAEKIVQKDGNYVLALKENHPRLLDDVRLYMQTEVMNQSKASLADCYFKRSEKGHGRIETRECYLCNDVTWLEGREQWKKLNGFAAIVTKREEIGQAASTHCDYFIYSHEQMTAEDLMKTKRKHWAIENQLHWMLDVTFREDLSRARIENAAENLNILRKLSLQLLKAETTVKGSMRAKRLRCGYDLFYALKVIGVNGFS